MDIKHTRKDINEYTHELNITIPADSFKHSYDLMLQDYSKELDIKGFRKGKVPANLINDETKEVLRFETFQRLAPLYVNTILEKENLDPIAPPEFKELPKFMDNLDIPFTITVTTMPKFTLGDMKKIKVPKEKISVEQSEIDSALEELKKSQKTKATEMNDEWAEEIGKLIKEENIKTLNDLKEKIKEALQKQKEHYQLHQMQDSALKLAIKESNIEIPQQAIDYEARERENAFIEDMKSRGIRIEDFLKTNNITIEKMRELWKLDAKEAIEADVLLTIYADSRNIQMTDEELNAKIEEIKKQRTDVDKSIFTNNEWRENMKRVGRKEKAFNAFIEEVLGKDYVDDHN
jgi:FKBP-type peptidyl-prolyl cis-trans isomerase (trigger factor)